MIFRGEQCYVFFKCRMECCVECELMGEDCETVGTECVKVKPHKRIVRFIRPFLGRI